uniref:hypothetical protein n=1 Tax=Nesterenkonia haasae TaxID=2587813 RepID=UPI001391D1A1
MALHRSACVADVAAPALAHAFTGDQRAPIGLAHPAAGIDHLVHICAVADRLSSSFGVDALLLIRWELIEDFIWVLNIWRLAALDNGLVTTEAVGVTVETLVGSVTPACKDRAS